MSHVPMVYRIHQTVEIVCAMLAGLAQDVTRNVPEMARSSMGNASVITKLAGRVICVTYPAAQVYTRSVAREEGNVIAQPPHAHVIRDG